MGEKKVGTLPLLRGGARGSSNKCSGKPLLPLHLHQRLITLQEISIYPEQPHSQTITVRTYLFMYGSYSMAPWGVSHLLHTVTSTVCVNTYNAGCSRLCIQCTMHCMLCMHCMHCMHCMLCMHCTTSI